MTDSVKATRATVQLGSLTIDGFMLPDGSYRMSQTQAAECVGDDTVYARNFLGSKTFKALRGEGYTPETFEVDSTNQGRGQTRIQGWTLDIVYAYWVYRCYKGNQKAFSLVIGLGTETLERRFDTAFGVNRTEQERDDRLSQQVREMERDLTKLGEAYAMEDEVRDELRFLKRWLQENGLDPWKAIDEGEDNT